MKISRLWPARELAIASATGALLGFVSWLEYLRLSTLDPFERFGVSGLLPAALLGAIVYHGRLRAIMWAIPGAFAFMIAVISYTPIMRDSTRSLIRQDVVTDVDAVVVLSSRVSDDELLDQQGLDRLIAGIQLAQSQGNRPLILTRTRVKGWERTVDSQPDQQRLLRLGTGLTDVILTGYPEDTHDEALLTLSVARKRGWQKVAVVTSPFHSRRACATFEKQGFLVVCVPALSRDVAVNTMMRGPDRLRAFQLWLYESIGTSEYRRRGWI